MGAGQLTGEITSTLPLHELRDGERYYLAVFLVGAYQEALGDLHNLFGDTDAIDVFITDDGGYRLGRPEWGDSVVELLRYVHFEPERMVEVYVERLREQGVEAAELDRFHIELRAGLQGYTYLKKSEQEAQSCE